MADPRRNDVKLHRLGPWFKGPMTGFDLETTGPNPETARIVGAAVVTVQAGRGQNSCESWLVNPGVPIEPEATAVHGITDQDAQETGLDPAFVVPVLSMLLRRSWELYRPVVIYNASFDLTVLDRELRRLKLAPLDDIGTVIDPFVLDKLVDRYRPGSRKLVDVAAHYKADRLDSLHGAESDAMAAVRTAWKIGYHYPKIGTMDPDKLQRLQAAAKRQQSDSLRQHMLRHGEVAEAAGVHDDWPIWPCPVETALVCDGCGANEAGRSDGRGIFCDECWGLTEGKCTECGAPMFEHTESRCPTAALLAPEWTT